MPIILDDVSVALLAIDPADAPPTMLLAIVVATEADVVFQIPMNTTDPVDELVRLIEPMVLFEMLVLLRLLL